MKKKQKARKPIPLKLRGWMCHIFECCNDDNAPRLARIGDTWIERHEAKLLIRKLEQFVAWAEEGAGGK